MRKREKGWAIVFTGEPSPLWTTRIPAIDHEKEGREIRISAVFAENNKRDATFACKNASLSSKKFKPKVVSCTISYEI